MSNIDFEVWVFGIKVFGKCNFFVGNDLIVLDLIDL